MYIHVKGLQFLGKHGVYPEERRDGRHFRADVTLELDDSVPLEDTDLTTTLDYRQIAEVVLRHGEGPSVQLIETMIEAIAADLFALSPRVLFIDLQILKKATGVPGDPEWVGVQVAWRRGFWEDKFSLTPDTST